MSPDSNEYGKLVAEVVLARRKSVLDAIKVPLAEIQELGMPRSVAYEFTKRVGITITRTGLNAWMNRHIGSNSGPDSEAASLVSQAISAGLYESKFSRARHSPVEAQSPSQTETKPKTASKDPEPKVPPDKKPASEQPKHLEGLTKEQADKKRQDIVDAAIAGFPNPFGRIQEKANLAKAPS